MAYRQLSAEIEERINADRRANWKNPYRFADEQVCRRLERDRASLLRPAFVRDIEKILHLPLYNRYTDKTQVFSFYHNDDISRRALHVQLVSRIARNIGELLGLNLHLIEAIALGHDIGHTPFGHVGERFLSELLYSNVGRYFNHNVHSVRVLDALYNRNVSLQTLDGILCHNGEFELQEYIPIGNRNFVEFDKLVEDCYVKGQTAIESLIPTTLEGCVVRLSDMIAYIGKDRQDALTARLLDEMPPFSSALIGSQNSEMINNLVVDIIENSYGKRGISMSPEVFEGLRTAKSENYRYIYQSDKINVAYNESLKPMFVELYETLLDDVQTRNENSWIYKHHINVIRENEKYYPGVRDYLSEEPNQIVVDYIAGMTDDYFIELYQQIFPESKRKIVYKSYFDE